MRHRQVRARAEGLVGRPASSGLIELLREGGRVAAVVGLDLLADDLHGRLDREEVLGRVERHPPQVGHAAGRGVEARLAAAGRLLRQVLDPLELVAVGHERLVGVHPRAHRLRLLDGQLDGNLFRHAKRSAKTNQTKWGSAPAPGRGATACASPNRDADTFRFFLRADVEQHGQIDGRLHDVRQALVAGQQAQERDQLRVEAVVVRQGLHAKRKRLGQVELGPHCLRGLPGIEGLQAVELAERGEDQLGELLALVPKRPVLGGDLAAVFAIRAQAVAVRQVFRGGRVEDIRGHGG